MHIMRYCLYYVYLYFYYVFSFPALIGIQHVLLLFIWALSYYKMSNCLASSSGSKVRLDLRCRKPTCTPLGGPPRPRLTTNGSQRKRILAAGLYQFKTPRVQN